MRRHPSGRHISEERLERYVFGRLKNLQIADLEEHLLTCETCQKVLDQLQKTIALIQAAAANAPARRKSKSKSGRNPHLLDSEANGAF